MYSIYYNKQQPSNITQSPNTDITIAQSPQFQSGVEQNQLIGIAAAGAIVIPAVNRVIDTSLNANGNVQTKVLIQRGRSLVGGALTLYGIGKVANPLLAVTGAVLNFGLNRYEESVDERVAQIDNAYNMQKRGVAINQFARGGVRYD